MVLSPLSVSVENARVVEPWEFIHQCFPHLIERKSQLKTSMQAGNTRIICNGGPVLGTYRCVTLASNYGSELSGLEELMELAPPAEITQLLRTWGDGNQESLAKLMPLVYTALHQAAHRYMLRERPGHTLQTTALINEVYLRLVDIKESSWESRAQFFALCAQLMRRVLTDFARSRSCAKRGGEVQHVSLDGAFKLSLESWSELTDIDEALQSLAKIDPRKAQVVELRFFGGLSVEKTAEVLKVSGETIMRDWKLAKVWLARELSGERHDAG
jgi:RNA polymerase sigma factor (TIGR02999 family)